MAKHALYWALTGSLLVTACGGGSDPASTKPGDELVSEIWVGEQQLQSSRYRLYGLNSKGELVTSSQDLASDYLVPVRVAPGTASDTLPIPANFPAELFQALGHYHGLQNPRDIAHEVHDLDAPLDTVHAAYVASGLSMADFVAKLEALDKSPLTANEELAEGRLLEAIASSTPVRSARQAPVDAERSLSGSDAIWKPAALIEQGHIFMNSSDRIEASLLHIQDQQARNYGGAQAFKDGASIRITSTINGMTMRNTVVLNGTFGAVHQPADGSGALPGTWISSLTAHVPDHSNADPDHFDLPSPGRSIYEEWQTFPAIQLSRPELNADGQSTQTQVRIYNHLPQFSLRNTFGTIHAITLDSGQGVLLAAP